MATAVLQVIDLDPRLLGPARWSWVLGHAEFVERSDAGAYALYFRYGVTGPLFRAEGMSPAAAVVAAEAGRAVLVESVPAVVSPAPVIGRQDGAR